MIATVDKYPEFELALNACKPSEYPQGYPWQQRLIASSADGVAAFCCGLRLYTAGVTEVCRGAAV